MMLQAKKASTAAIESASAIAAAIARGCSSRRFRWRHRDCRRRRAACRFEQRAAFLEESGDTYSGALNALDSTRGRTRAAEECRRVAGPAQTHRGHSRASEFSAGIARSEYRLLDRAPRSRRSSQPCARRAANASYHTHLQATPIDVSRLLAATLFEEYSSVVLTSATLTGRPAAFDTSRRIVSAWTTLHASWSSLRTSTTRTGAAVSATEYARPARA